MSEFRNINIVIAYAKRVAREVGNFPKLNELIEQAEMDASHYAAELAALAKQPCTWTENLGYDDVVWETSCGQSFVLETSTPAENEMKFCCYCGGVLVEERYTEGE